jgi:hypothetical protein
MFTAAGDPSTVKSAVASLSAPVGLRSDDDNVDNGASTSPNDSGTGAVEGGLQQVQALSASKPVGESDAIHKDERKNKNAVDFLKEVGLHVTQHSN